MRRCKFEDSIDDYLLNKLSEGDRERFEEHYFNCQHCFEKMVERDELIAVVKNKGHLIFEEDVSVEKEVFSFEKIFTFLTPKQWALATATVALFLIIFLGVVPLLKKTPTQFILDKEEIVRGKSIALFAPVEDLKAIPTQFRWEGLGENVEYRISLYSGNELIWAANTKNIILPVPENIKSVLRRDHVYSWQVKAFSPQGALIANSGKVQFTIVQIEPHR
ncbi:MAG: zf-HC2 domain-containing protein [Candidatus Aminicenantaceae bacterium]